MAIQRRFQHPRPLSCRKRVPTFFSGIVHKVICTVITSNTVHILEGKSSNTHGQDPTQAVQDTNLSSQDTHQPGMLRQAYRLSRRHRLRIRPVFENRVSKITIMER